MMRFMMIVADPEIARYALASGVDRIFVDLERLGKLERQGHRDTWISRHDAADIARLRAVIPERALLVRLNPWHGGSLAEIENAIAAGADQLMLPMFRTLEELAGFCRAVRDRVPVIPLVETPEAMALLPEIARMPGIGEVYIGLNDLHLALGLHFMFEPLANGMLDRAAEILHAAGMPFGFGGIARCGEGLLPAEKVLGEHVRLGSSSVILSRTFHRQASSLEALKGEMDFPGEVVKLRRALAAYGAMGGEARERNRQEVARLIRDIARAAR